MKTFWLLVVLAAAGIFGPGLLENTGNSCSVLEKRLIALVSAANRTPQAAAGDAFFLGLLQGASNARFAEAVMKQRFPDIPIAISCPMGYWESVLNPPSRDELRRLTQS